MKTLDLICRSLLLLTSFLLIGCGSASNTVDTAMEAESGPSTNTTDARHETASGSRQAIFEIWRDLDGSVTLRGRSLFFRMYDDGSVERDYEVRKDNPTGRPRYIYSLERTAPVKVSEEEFIRFKVSLEDLKKAKNIKREYKWVALTLDVLTKLTIHLNENGEIKRKIIINDGPYDVTNMSLERHFPKSLVNLFKEVHLIRERSLSRPA